MWYTIRDVYRAGGGPGGGRSMYILSLSTTTYSALTHLGPENRLFNGHSSETERDRERETEREKISEPDSSIISVVETRGGELIA
mgnify:CR=1 FL=1